MIARRGNPLRLPGSGAGKTGSLHGCKTTKNKKIKVPFNIIEKSIDFFEYRARIKT
jgi:hypothetical protein